MATEKKALILKIRKISEIYLAHNERAREIWNTASHPPDERVWIDTTKGDFAKGENCYELLEIEGCG